MRNRTWFVWVGLPGVLAASAGCASGEAVSSDAGIRAIFADASPTAPDSGPRPDMPPDAAPLADAMPFPDAQPPPDAMVGCTDQTIDLLVNGNFDDGQDAEWDETSGGGYALVTSDFGAPQSGSYVAWLGGYNSGTDILYQDVDVPAGATTLQLAGYYVIGTEETIGAYDVAAIELRTPSGTLLETLASWDNEDAVSTWTPFTAAPSGTYQGQTVRLYVRSQHDSTLATSFVFDTVSLRATVCL